MRAGSFGAVHAFQNVEEQCSIRSVIAFGLLSSYCLVFRVHSSNELESSINNEYPLGVQLRPAAFVVRCNAPAYMVILNWG